MIKLVKYSAALLALLGVGGCATNVVPTYQIYNPVDGVQEYTQRADTVTLSAGDAQDVNTRVQEIDPWPSPQPEALSLPPTSVRSKRQETRICH